MVTMPQLDHAFTTVRGELYELGLLDDGFYLDEIDLVRSVLPSLGTQGYVFHGGVGPLARLVGFRDGTIYVPWNSPVSQRDHGQTLTDVIRHEFAHAWAWLNPRRVDGPWFRKAFGGRYDDDGEQDGDDEEFVSEYAMTSPAEDFAETFMFFLKYRRSLSRFRGRPGVWRKMRAMRAAVRRTAREIRR